IKNGDPIPGLPGKTWNILSDLQLSPEGTKAWVWVKLDDKYQILECDRDLTTGALSNAKPLIKNGDPIPGMSGKTWNIVSNLQLSPEGTKVWVRVKLDGTFQILECDRDPTTGALSNAKPLIKNGDPIPGLPGKTWTIDSNLQLSPEGTKGWVRVFLDGKNQILELTSNQPQGETGQPKTPAPLLSSFSVETVIEKIVATLGKMLKKEKTYYPLDVEKLKKMKPEDLPFISTEVGAPVQSVAYSPDGNYLAVGHHKQDATDTTPAVPAKIILFKRENAKWVKTKEFVGHSDHIQEIAFSPDGQTLASGSCDNTIKLWDVNATTNDKGVVNTPLKSFKGHKDSVYSRAFNQTEKGIVYSLAFSPDGKNIASGATDNTIKLWDVNADADKKGVVNTPLKSFEGHKSTVYSLAFSPDGKNIASGSWDTTIKLWDVNADADEKGVVEKPLKSFKEQGIVYSLAFSPDGKNIASGNWDTTIKLWDVNADVDEKGVVEKPLKSFKGQGIIYSLAFSPDGQTLASGSNGKTIELWDVNAITNDKGVVNTPLKSFKGHREDVYSLAFSPDGKNIASGSADKTVREWTLPVLDPVTVTNNSNNSIHFLETLKLKFEKLLDRNKLQFNPFLSIAVLGLMFMESLPAGIVALISILFLIVLFQDRVRKGKKSSLPQVEPSGLSDWGSLSFEQKGRHDEPITHQLSIVQVKTAEEISALIGTHEQNKNKNDLLVFVGPSSLKEKNKNYLFLSEEELRKVNLGEISLSQVIQKALIENKKKNSEFIEAFIHKTLQIKISIEETKWTAGGEVIINGKNHSLDDQFIQIYLRGELFKNLPQINGNLSLNDFFKSLEDALVAA
ncbi:MAG: WD40 repeat domain-containing protein, partial [Elusimicrobiota bacterium]